MLLTPAAIAQTPSDAWSPKPIKSLSGDFDGDGRQDAVHLRHAKDSRFQYEIVVRLAAFPSGEFLLAAGGGEEFTSSLEVKPAGDYRVKPDGKPVRSADGKISLERPSGSVTRKYPHDVILGARVEDTRLIKAWETKDGRSDFVGRWLVE